ncbi:MAG: pyrroline-5-carboxylate reductase [Rhodobacterales bacterium]|nr:MAG: pyrroline-5-carboxylate reductase [Rhodobacterales bacterium]
MQELNENGLVILGCGKMGSAMLAGWLEAGVKPGAVWVLDPHPSDWLQSIEGLNLNRELPEAPAVVLIAVKPQMMGDALPAMAKLGGGETLFVSVAAGTTLAAMEAVLGAGTPVVRAMPNTPAAIGKGVTAIVGNDKVTPAGLDLAHDMLEAVGKVVRLEREDQLDAVTAVSGCGPAYVFHLIEAMAAAGEALGVAPDLALELARATVSGAGQLAEASEETPSQLRVNVTSPGGVTAEALKVLMNEEDGFPPLLLRAMQAAVDKSRELGE